MRKAGIVTFCAIAATASVVLGVTGLQLGVLFLEPRFNMGGYYIGLGTTVAALMLSAVATLVAALYGAWRLWPTASAAPRGGQPEESIARDPKHFG